MLLEQLRGWRRSWVEIPVSSLCTRCVPEERSRSWRGGPIGTSDPRCVRVGRVVNKLDNDLARMKDLHVTRWHFDVDMSAHSTYLRLAMQAAEDRRPSASSEGDKMPTPPGPGTEFVFATPG